MTLKSDAKFEKNKLIRGFENDMGNMANFH